MSAPKMMVVAVVMTVALGGCNPSRSSAPPPAQAAKPSESPQAFLTRIYKPYAVQDAAGVFQMTPEGLAQYFEPKLGAALLQTSSAASARNLEPSPKGDAFINAFRWHTASLDIEALRVEAKDQGGGRATGTVSFKNFYLSKVMDIDLVAQPEGWRISDIRYGPNQSLRRLVGLEPGGRAEQVTAAELAARFRRAVLEGNVEAVATMIDPSGLLGHDPWVSSREDVLHDLKARRGAAHWVLFSTKEERAAKGSQHSADFMSHREYFQAHPDITARLANWGVHFVEARWSETGHDPNKLTGPVVVLSRDFLGQAWVRALDDAMD